MRLKLDDDQWDIVMAALQDRAAKLDAIEVSSAPVTQILAKILEAKEELASPAHAALVEQARELYAIGSDDDIEVDDDAMLSPADEGCWVSMWGWIRYPDPEDEEGEE